MYDKARSQSQPGKPGQFIAGIGCNLGESQTATKCVQCELESRGVRIVSGRTVPMRCLNEVCDRFYLYALGKQWPLVSRGTVDS